MKTFSLAGVLCLLGLVGAAGAATAQTMDSTAAPLPRAESSASLKGMSTSGLSWGTISSAMTARTVPSPLCSAVPSAVSAFSSTDASVYLYFRISGYATGEQLTAVWWDPYGAVYKSSPWDPLGTAGSTYCLSSRLDVAGTAAASRTGQWTVQVFSSQITDVPYLTLYFTVSGGGGGLPTVTYAMTTKSVASDPCSAIPSSATSFLSTDPAVYLYFRITGFQNGEGLTAVWWDPSGQVHASHPWDPLSTQYAGYCLADRLDLAGTSASGKPGSWRVQVFSDKLTDVPYVDLPFTITSGGGAVAGTWLLTSSARVQGAGAFWQTDLSVRNTGSSSASVTVKFLGHSGDGRGGPERSYTIPAGQTQTWRDALWTLFGLSNDYGPILVRSTSASMAVLGQTWTSGGGGTYGQSVPALATAELIGATPRSILGVRQDSSFRTNLMLANATESTVSVTVQLVSTTGTLLGTQSRTLGPLSRDQLNVGNDFGYANLADAVFVISSPTPGAAVGAYASVIDAATQDPRTLLPR